MKIISLLTILLSIATIETASANNIYTKGYIMEQTTCARKAIYAHSPTRSWVATAINGACGAARSECVKAEAKLRKTPFHCAQVGHEITFIGVVEIPNCAGKKGYQGQVEVDCTAMAYDGPAPQLELDDPSPAR